MGYGLPLDELSQSISFLTRVTGGVTQSRYREGEVVYSHGQIADCVFYIHKGCVKKNRVSSSGKTRTVAIFGQNQFLGVDCLAGLQERPFSAVALTDCVLARIEKKAFVNALHEQRTLADVFISSLIDLNMQAQEELSSLLFDSCEQRLARTLLFLSEGGLIRSEEAPSGIPRNSCPPRMSQESLAEIVGTTRPRINFLLRKFRELGLVVETAEGIRVVPRLKDRVMGASGERG